MVDLCWRGSTGRRRLKREKEGDREGSVFCSVPVGCWNQNGHDKYDKS